MNWIDAFARPPTKPGPHVVYCGLDTCRVPIYFIAVYRHEMWWVDESEDALELDVLAWAELTPWEGPK